MLCGGKFGHGFAALGTSFNVLTPYEKVKSLTDADQYLARSFTFEQFDVAPDLSPAG